MRNILHSTLLFCLLNCVRPTSSVAQTGPGLQIEAGGALPVGASLSYVHPFLRKPHWEVFGRAGFGLLFSSSPSPSIALPAGISAEWILNTKRSVGRLEFTVLFPNVFARHLNYQGNLEELNSFITAPLPQIGYRARFGNLKHSIRAGASLGLIPPGEEPHMYWPMPYLGYAFHW